MKESEAKTNLKSPRDRFSYKVLFVSGLKHLFMIPHRQQVLCLWVVSPSVGPFTPFLWILYSIYSRLLLRDFFQTWCECRLWLKDELIRFWRSKVNVTVFIIDVVQTFVITCIPALPFIENQEWKVYYICGHRPSEVFVTFLPTALPLQPFQSFFPTHHSTFIVHFVCFMETHKMQGGNFSSFHVVFVIMWKISNRKTI